MELLTSAQMQAIERAAIDSGFVTGAELMERAGRGAVEAILAHWPQHAAAPGRVVVLCGPGNNGGDGYVVARLLSQKGWQVHVISYGDIDKLPPDAAENHRRWCRIGDVDAVDVLPEADLYVDALFGGGLSRTMPDDLRHVYSDLDPDRADRTIAIDAPSGLCLDSGRVIGWALSAALTVTFQRPRLGHYLADGPHHCGEVIVRDIGLEDSFGDLAIVETLSAPPAALMMPPPTRGLSKAVGAHKYAHGHALVLSGGVGRGGAARLAARGALRVGAGLVTLGVPPAAIMENASRLDAIMLTRIDDAAALGDLMQDERINALVLGPGLGVGERTRELVHTALTKSRAGVVLDADALTAFQDGPDDLFALTTGRQVVLTPHMGEFGRLFPDISARLQTEPVAGPAFSRVDAVRAAAHRSGCTVLLKGADTVIADRHGQAFVVSAQYERACPWLATAGAGDVLAGMIGGLLARGRDAVFAARTSAWLHQAAAISFGPGLIAEDIAEELPKIFRDLGL